MPRPKGSKNKKNAILLETVENIDEKIAAAESEIASLTEALKAKKAELKKLTKAKDKAKAEEEKVEAEKKAEADKAKLLDAFTASGKSVDEIIGFMNAD